MKNLVDIVDYLTGTSQKLEELRDVLYSGSASFDEDLQDSLHDHVDSALSEIEEAIVLISES